MLSNNNLSFITNNVKGVQSLKKIFFLNWDSFHARLNSHCKAWSYEKKKHKKIKAYTKSL